MQQLIDKETALVYGYVMLGKTRKAKADRHIRRMIQLVRSVERPTVTQLRKILERVRSFWQEHVIDNAKPLEEGMDLTND